MFLAAFGWAVLCQWYGNAYRAGWSASHDEAGHYVTGLLVHDYIAGGLSKSPVPFAVDYYEHYPRVALGHWPPAFYIVQTAWTLVFGASTQSLLILMAVITAALATLTFWWASWIVSHWIAVLAAITLLSLPLVLTLNRMLMSDHLLAVFSLGALFALERYLNDPGWRSASLFGLFASCALMTKGSGIVLAPVPLLAILLLGKIPLLRRWDFWLPAIIVLCLCGPWYALMPGALHERVDAYGGLTFSWMRIVRSLSDFWSWHNIGALAFVCAGFGALLSKLRRGPLDTISALILVFLFSNLLFRGAVRVWSPRQLVLAMPAVAILAAIGIAWLSETYFTRHRTAVAALIAVMLVAPLYANLIDLPPKPDYGAAKLAASLMNGGPGPGAPIVVAADVLIEGLMVAAIAERDQRPGRLVRRGWQLIGGGRHPFRPPAPAPANEAELMDLFSRIGDFVLVLQDTSPVPAHTLLVREAIHRFPSRWTLVGAHSIPAPGGGRLLIYHPRSITQ